MDPVSRIQWKRTRELKAKGLPQEAAAEYRTASRREPENPFYLKQERSFPHYRPKDHGEAFRCLSESFRRDPSDPAIQKTLLKISHRLQSLPPHTLLVLLSDHGFRENPAFNRKDNTPPPATFTAGTPRSR